MENLLQTRSKFADLLASSVSNNFSLQYYFPPPPSFKLLN